MCTKCTHLAAQPIQDSLLSTCLYVSLFIQQIFTQFLLWARHYAKFGEYNSFISYHINLQAVRGVRQ